MKLLQYSLVAIFAIFLGSQITEGVILVPFWQSLSPEAFHAFHQQFGASIGRFYTILTVIAALTPISIAIIYYSKKSSGFKYALVSAILALLFVASFYVYFKDANALFNQTILSEERLKSALITWNKWHWARIGIEFLSLVFLILAFSRNTLKK